MLTERDLAVLRAVVRYYVLSRPQIQRLCFPTDKTGRITRRRLAGLVSLRLISRQNLLFSHLQGGPPAAVYFPAPLGCEFLASEFEDERYLVSPAIPPTPHHVPHWLALSETHIVLDAALKNETEIRVEGFLNEWDIVNKDESVPEKRYRLYTLLQESPRLVCAPDAALLLNAFGHKKVFYLEQDRNTTGARQIAESKTKGYAALADRKGNLRHFPEATVEAFSVIMVAPTPKRRDILRKTIHGKPGSALWRFVAADDLRPETLLYAPIFYPCDGEPLSLIRRKEA